MNPARFTKSAPYAVGEKAQRQVAYADRWKLEEEILRRHHSDPVKADYADCDYDEDEEAFARDGGIRQEKSIRLLSKTIHLRRFDANAVHFEKTALSIVKSLH
jgi:hypothetical protein